MKLHLGLFHCSPLWRSSHQIAARCHQEHHSVAREAGKRDIPHVALAQFTSCAVSTIQDALRRLRAVGLVEWESRFHIVAGLRRQVANDYRLTMPTEATRVSYLPAFGGGLPSSQAISAIITPVATRRTRSAAARSSHTP
jgi:hypothetical protein